MDNILLIRHGEPDYQNVLCKKNKAGITIGINSIGLSPAGIAKCEASAQIISSFNPNVIVSSPYTRALHSSLLFSTFTLTPIHVENSLSEWLTSCSIQIDGRDEYNKMLKEVSEHKGVYDESCKYQWESITELTERAMLTISHYSTLYERIVVVSHKMLIFQLTGKSLPFCGYVITNLMDIMNRINHS